MEPKQQQRGAVRVGMIWGAIGGVIGFLVALIGGAVAGVLVAGFTGFSCGRRAAVAEAGRSSGALAGLISGALAAPVFVIAAAAGSIISARNVSTAEMSRMVSDMAGLDIPPDQVWQMFLLSLVFAGFIQAALLILVSTATGAWSRRKRSDN